MKIQLTRTKHIQINEMIEKFEQDYTVHFRQVHRMIDLFETIIKTHTTFLLANYFQAHEVSDAVAKVLVQGMYTPSLGIWLRFNEVVYKELAFNHIPSDVYEAIYEVQAPQNKEKMDLIYEKKDDTFSFRPEEESAQVRQKSRFLARIFSTYYTSQNKNGKPFTHLALPSFYTEYRDWHNAMNDKVVHFRNEYAHGATPSEEKCRQHIEQFLPILKQSLSLSWLHETSVVVFDENLETLEIGSAWTDVDVLRLKRETESHIPYLVLPDQTLLRLFPTVTFQPITKTNTQSISFFNDLKKYNSHKISYLNYPYAKHIQDDAVFSRFTEVFRIEEWREQVLDEFEDLMLRLRESFKGRTEELDFLHNFAKRNNRGFLYVYGIPGIGKSSLIANSFHETDDTYNVIKYFVRNRKYTHVTEVLDYLNRMLDRIYRMQLPLGDTEEEKRARLHERLQHISAYLVKENKKLILMIDGLDEGDQALLNNLIFETYTNVLVVYIGRQTPEVTRFINDLPLDYLTKKEIGNIEHADIRAMLYDVVNKYEITDEYVNAIAEKSGGHPLYVKLLCEELAQNPDKLNEHYHLPEKWEEFYKRFIDRFIDDEHGQQILEGLFVFAAAKDYLSSDHMRIILRNNVQQNLIIFDRLSELLIESLQHRHHYQLFHETFHEFLLKHYAFDIMDAEHRLLDYCLQWDKLERYGESMLLYPLHHMSSHLADNRDLQSLEKLVHDKVFIQKQIEITGQFTASFVLLERYRSIAYEKNNTRAMIDAMAQIVTLNDRLRSSELADQLNIDDLSYTKWKHQVENIRYYNEEEKGRLLFMDIWYRLALSKDELERIIDEVEKLLPTDTSLFNWSDYVPLPLLIDLSVQLHTKNINPSFIVNRIKVNKADFERVITSVKLQEESVQIMKLYIDRVESRTGFEWFELIVQLIEKMFENDLQHVVKFYEKLLISTLKTNENNFLFEEALIQLAICYIKSDWISDAFNVIDTITYGPIKETAYRTLYNTFKTTQRTVAKQSYTLGIDYVISYSYENRLDVITKWLSIVKKAGPLDVYDSLLSEVEEAVRRKEAGIEFTMLGDLANHYWDIGHYDDALHVIDEINDDGEFTYPILQQLHEASKSDDCPSHIKETLAEKYSEMEKDILSNRLYNQSIYVNETAYIIENLIKNDQANKVATMISHIADGYIREQLLLTLLETYINMDDQTPMIQTALQLAEFQRNAIDLLMKNNVTDALLSYLKKVPSPTDRESLYFYSACRALEKRDNTLFNKLKEKVNGIRNREQIKFNEIFETCLCESNTNAIEMFAESVQSRPVTEEIIHETDIGLVKRLFHKGKITEAYEIVDNLPFAVSNGAIARDVINVYVARNDFSMAIDLFDREFTNISLINEPFNEDKSTEVRKQLLMKIIFEMSKRGDGGAVELLEQYYEKTNLYPSSLYPHFTAIKLFERGGTGDYTGRIINICEKILAENPLESVTLGIALYPTVAIHCDLSRYYYKNNEKMKARHILQRIIRFFSEDVNFDQTNMMMSYLRIAYECERQGLKKEFEQFTYQYKSLYISDYKDIVWRIMVGLYTADNQIEQALSAISKLTRIEGSLYILMIQHLLTDKHYDQALHVYDRLTKAVSEEKNEHVIEAKKLLLHYVIDEQGWEAALKLVQIEQQDDFRIELYKEMLPSLTIERLDLLINSAVEEPSNVKRRIEKEILLYMLTNPDFKAVQLQEVMPILSVDRDLTILALYIYRTFHKHKFDTTMDETTLETVNTALQLQ